TRGSRRHTCVSSTPTSSLPSGGRRPGGPRLRRGPARGGAAPRADCGGAVVHRRDGLLTPVEDVADREGTGARLLGVPARGDGSGGGRPGPCGAPGPSRRPRGTRAEDPGAI